MNLLVLNRYDVEALLDIRTAIALVGEAMRSLSRGDTSQLVRRILPLPGASAGLGDMPGSLGAGKPFGLKCIAGFLSPARGQSSHRGAVMLFDPCSGEPVTVIEAGLLTAIRTAAATAFATQHLARANSRVLGIYGTSEQSRWHVPALLAARPFDRVLIWGRDRQKADVFAKSMSKTHGVACEALTDPAAVAKADVLCTLTSAPEPVLRGEWIRAGTHVNLVGSSSATSCEADEACVAKSRYFVDWESSARVQASEYLRAVGEGIISDDHVLGEIGAVANGTVPGRLLDTDITLYKSLGVIVQDLVCGWYVYEKASTQSMGQRVKF